MKGKDEVQLKELSAANAQEIVQLARKLNPAKTEEELKDLLKGMFELNTYHCFGLYQNNILAGISSGWITTRFYSGKQLEIDNVIVDEQLRSSGLGKQFLVLLEEWAKARSCKTLELNTYVQNSRSHKFYFNAGYEILGFHFQKRI